MRPPAYSDLTSIAARQYGCFTREQAREAGVSDVRLRALVASGVVDRMSRRAFRFAAASRTWLQSVMIACLDGGPDCVASHRTAAALHRLDGFDRSGLVEILVPMRVRHRRFDVVVHHSRDLPDIDRTVVDAVPVTTIARTLIDLGAVFPATKVQEAMDAAERDARLRRSTIVQRYTSLRAPGRNGVGAMTQILRHRADEAHLPRSVLERRVIRLLERARLPLPIPRYVVELDGRRAELDFAYPAQRFGIEVDGHGSHATRRQRASDNDRANLLSDAGWSLRRFTYEQVVYQERLVSASIRRALESTSRRL